MVEDGRGPNEAPPPHERVGATSIRILPPSEDSHHTLDFALRWGGDTEIRLANQELPPAYPFSRIEVVFESGRYETPNEAGQITPKWVSWYTIGINARLREPRTFTHDDAKKIALALQLNEQKGNARFLPNGHSQVTVPDLSVMKPYDAYDVFYTQNPHGQAIAVMDMGITDSEERTAYLQREKDSARFASDYRYYETELEKLRQGVGTTVSDLRIELNSHYLDRNGHNVEMRGKLDRNFFIDPHHPNQHPFDVPSDYLGVYADHILPFFDNAGFMLQAVCDSMGLTNLPEVIVPVEIPSQDDQSSWNAEKGIPPVIREFLNGLGFK